MCYMHKTYTRWSQRDGPHPGREHTAGLRALDNEEEDGMMSTGGKCLRRGGEELEVGRLKVDYIHV